MEDESAEREKRRKGEIKSHARELAMRAGVSQDEKRRK